MQHPPFAAIDFETGDAGRDSACAVSVIRCEGGDVVARRTTLLRPPRPINADTERIHGISDADVRGAPTFGQAWPEFADILGGIAFLAAHNAPFDRSVLQAVCESAGLQPPEVPFVCTVKHARAAWNLRRANLPAVCEHLGLSLRHHDPESDAEACARIVLALLSEGRDLIPPPPAPPRARRRR